MSFEMLKEEERAKCTEKTEQLHADVKGLIEEYSEEDVSIS